uniref:Nicotinic acetylcholine receptor alpha 1 subunit n=1 Tax=Strigamia maritima TaxID=126957 RepID=T1IUC5_STRMM
MVAILQRFLFTIYVSLLVIVTIVLCNPDAKRLYDDLLSNYNRLIRPVGNNSDRLTVKMGLKLSQLIDVNLKSQIMTTNVWVLQEWQDYKLVWDPAEYGGVATLHVPSEHIWLPDIVLYNNSLHFQVLIKLCFSAEGNYEVTIMTKAILNYTGYVQWRPPAIYKSSCEIDVEYFPFDKQTCLMKFGSWTYDGYMVDLKHLNGIEGISIVDVGIDLREFYLSVEWDVMAVPAVRNEKFYSCCEEPYPDITFNITLRRKTLFYTVNLIIPCVGISYLSVLVFILPSDSGEKMSLCIGILLSLTVFFLLLVEIIPPTSVAVPLMGKYLLFTMILVSMSVVITIIVLNVNFRSPSTHRMAPWVKKFFLEIAPRFLCMKRPQDEEAEAKENGNHTCKEVETHAIEMDEKRPNSPLFDSRYGLALPSAPDEYLPSDYGDVSPIPQEHRNPELDRAVYNVSFMAQRLKNQDEYDQIEQDWKYVALVMDRMFLLLFAVSCLLGTCVIILQAPSIYDYTIPFDVQVSKIAKPGDTSTFT